jgi:uncharacterized protein (DUF1697 family)
VRWADWSHVSAKQGVVTSTTSTYIVFLRAVNVGGTGKLAMADLRAMCEAAGFTSVKTYIASGNLVLNSTKSAHALKVEVEAILATYAGKPVGVVVFTSAEVASIFARNPFADKDANQTVAILLDGAPAIDTVSQAKGRATEGIELGDRVVYVHYDKGISKSKLKVPTAASGTARNMNTVAAVLKVANPDNPDALAEC